jgi:hypothetical protein
MPLCQHVLCHRYHHPDRSRGPCHEGTLPVIPRERKSPPTVVTIPTQLKWLFHALRSLPGYRRPIVPLFDMRKEVCHGPIHYVCVIP